MLMKDLLDYIHLKGRVNLLDLSRHFKMNESAIENILALWIKKGKVRLFDADQACQTASQTATKKSQCTDCSGCTNGTNKIYIWIEP